MARSHAIWLLIDKENNYAPVGPVAAFTVKHEMMTWLERNRWQWSILSLFRMVDGPDPSPLGTKEDDVQELDIWEVMR